MCYCKDDADIEEFKEGFKETVSRGPDQSEIVRTADGIMGFHRLAIMGLTPSGMQPFEYNGNYVICNGEIYGFKALKDELIANSGEPVDMHSGSIGGSLICKYTAPSFRTPDRDDQRAEIEFTFYNGDLATIFFSAHETQY